MKITKIDLLEFEKKDFIDLILEIQEKDLKIKGIEVASGILKILSIKKIEKKRIKLKKTNNANSL